MRQRWHLTALALSAEGAEAVTGKVRESNGGRRHGNKTLQRLRHQASEHGCVGLDLLLHLTVSLVKLLGLCIIPSRALDGLRQHQHAAGGALAQRTGPQLLWREQQ